MPLTDSGRYGRAPPSYRPSLCLRPKSASSPPSVPSVSANLSRCRRIWALGDKTAAAAVIRALKLERVAGRLGAGERRGGIRSITLTLAPPPLGASSSGAMETAAALATLATGRQTATCLAFGTVLVDPRWMLAITPATKTSGAPCSGPAMRTRPPPPQPPPPINLLAVVSAGDAETTPEKISSPRGRGRRTFSLGEISNKPFHWRFKKKKKKNTPSPRECQVALSHTSLR